MALVIGPNAPTEPMAGQAGFDGVEEAAWGPPRNGLSVSVKMGVSVNEGTGMSSERVPTMASASSLVVLADRCGGRCRSCGDRPRCCRVRGGPRAHLAAADRMLYLDDMALYDGE